MKKFSSIGHGGFFYLGGVYQLIKFANLTKSFSSLKIFADLTYFIKQGEFICICGPSGVGKTTLLHLAAGLIKPDSGCIEKEEGSRIGYVFQEPRLLPWCTVLENIELGLYYYYKEDTQRMRKVSELLARKVELQGFEQYYPAQLSGGMKQRVSLARAFAIEPDILLLDEPFSALDYQLKGTLREQLINLLHWKPCTTIMVTHDLLEAVQLGDRILILDGRPSRVANDFEINLPRGKRSSEYCQKIINQFT